MATSALPADLILVRHGESEGNVANHASKQGDDSHFTEEFRARHSRLWRLTDQGIAQAKAAGDWLRSDGWIQEHLGGRFDRYYTSEYLRAAETAVHLQLPAAEWQVEIYLRERNWGALEGMTVAEREAGFPNVFARRKINGFYWTPPDGESIADQCLRCDRVTATLTREVPGGSALITCHEEVMWGFRFRFERMTVERFLELDASKDPVDSIHNCQVLHYTRRDPASGEVASPRFEYLRSVCPWDVSLSRNTFEPIIRRRYSNDDLAALIDRHPRLIER